MEMNETEKIAYCGLFCGECIIKDQKIGKQSEQLLNVMKTPKFQKLSAGLPEISPEFWGKLIHVEKTKAMLEAMCNLDCDRSCKKGGGGSSCEIRICCKDKDFNGCWECEEMENCRVLDSIFPVHKGTNVRNMQIIKEKGIGAFLSGEKYW